MDQKNKNKNQIIIPACSASNWIIESPLCNLASLMGVALACKMESPLCTLVGVAICGQSEKKNTHKLEICAPKFVAPPLLDQITIIIHES